jgi:hypothetical protein
MLELNPDGHRTFNTPGHLGTSDLRVQAYMLRAVAVSRFMVTAGTYKSELRIHQILRLLSRIPPGCRRWKPRALCMLSSPSGGMCAYKFIRPSHC